MEKCALTAIFFLVMTGFYTVGWCLWSFPFDNMLLWDLVQLVWSGRWSLALFACLVVRFGWSMVVV